MNEWARALMFFLSCVFTDNVVFTRALGGEALLGASDNLKSAARLGMATAVVMLISSMLGWAAYHLALTPLGMSYLAAPANVVLISLVVWAVGALAPESARLRPALPFMYVNSAILGTALINLGAGYDLLYSALSGLFGGVGFFVAIALLAEIRERLSKSDVPAGMRGLPIGIVMTGLMSMAFLGLSGIIR